jgi:hypothetical protein
MRLPSPLTHLSRSPEPQVFQAIVTGIKAFRKYSNNSTSPEKRCLAGIAGSHCSRLLGMNFGILFLSGSVPECPEHSTSISRYPSPNINLGRLRHNFTMNSMVWFYCLATLAMYSRETAQPADIRAKYEEMGNTVDPISKKTVFETLGRPGILRTYPSGARCFQFDGGHIASFDHTQRYPIVCIYGPVFAFYSRLRIVLVECGTVFHPTRLKSELGYTLVIS